MYEFSSIEGLEGWRIFLNFFHILYKTSIFLNL